MKNEPAMGPGPMTDDELERVIYKVFGWSDKFDVGVRSTDQKLLIMDPETAETLAEGIDGALSHDILAEVLDEVEEAELEYKYIRKLNTVGRFYEKKNELWNQLNATPEQKLRAIDATIAPPEVE